MPQRSRGSILYHLSPKGLMVWHPYLPRRIVMAHARSRQLMRDSRALLTEVQAVLDDARPMLARQRYRTMVCAWCQQTIRWERCAPDAWGQVSHSMGFACFVGVFPALAPGTIPPPSVHGGTVRYRATDHHYAWGRYPLSRQKPPVF